MGTVATGVSVRAATAADAGAIAAVHSQGIEERTATFETGATSTAEAEAWLDGGPVPVLVAELDGDVVGFARVTPAGERCAQAGVGEYTIYLAAAARGRGIGRLLLEALVAEAERAGHWKLIGKVFTTNAASIALADRCGFRRVGVYERHGRLDGLWVDVLLVERLLGGAGGA